MAREVIVRNFSVAPVGGFRIHVTTSAAAAAAAAAQSFGQLWPESESDEAVIENRMPS